MISAEAVSAVPGKHRRLPQQPRFLRELVVVHSRNTTIIEGAHQPYTLTGKGAEELLPRLIPLMDGTRTLDQIRRELPGIPAAAVHSTVYSLFNWGLLEDAGESEASSLTSKPEALSFFRRFAGAMGDCTGLEAFQRLQNSEILILDSNANSAQTLLLQQLLQQGGARNVSSVTPESLMGGHPPSPLHNRSSIIVASGFPGEDPLLNARLDQWCHNHGRSWLRAAHDQPQGYADLGPFFDGIHPCYECFAKMYGGPGCSGFAPAAKLPNLNPEFLVALLAMEIICRLTAIGPSATEEGFLRYDLKDWTARNLRPARIPGCSLCLPVAGLPTAIPAVDTAIIFENHVSHAARPRISTSLEQHLAKIGTEVARRFTVLTHCERVALPSIAEEPRLQVNSVDPLVKQPLLLQQLATILSMTAGIRQPLAGERVWRWAASAGNLGSVELFVAVSKVSGLSPGIYFYQAADHSLALVRRYDVPAICSFMQRIACLDSAHLPEVLVLFTGALHKVTRKYANFGYRLLHLDCGVALSQLHFVARSLNCGARTLERWVDDVAERELNLCPSRQQVTAVASLFTETPAPPNSPGSACPAQNGSPKSTRNIREYSIYSTEQIFELLVLESKITEHDLLLPAFKVAPELNSSPFARRSSCCLPPPLQVQSTPGKVLARRTSARRFRAEPLTLDQLGSMLNSAQARDEEDWPHEHAEHQKLKFFVLAKSVSNLRLGFYEYDYQRHGLDLIKEDIDADLSGLFVQPEFGTAPAAILITGNLASGCARWGAFGYRQLLLRAGAAANRLWISALDLGLAGCIVAGLVAGATTRQLGLDGYRSANLLAFVVGHRTETKTIWP